MNPERLKKMQEQVRIGGKKSPRRKVKKVITKAVSQTAPEEPFEVTTSEIMQDQLAQKVSLEEFEKEEITQKNEEITLDEIAPIEEVSAPIEEVSVPIEESSNHEMKDEKEESSNHEMKDEKEESPSKEKVLTQGLTVDHEQETLQEASSQKIEIFTSIYENKVTKKESQSLKGKIQCWILKVKNRFRKKKVQE